MEMLVIRYPEKIKFTKLTAAIWEERFLEYWSRLDAVFWKL